MRRFKGYMTLEAALVVPMALCVIVVIIYSTYFLYGKCLLTQDTYILAFRASVQNYPEWEDNPAGYVLHKAPEVLGKKYFGNITPYIRPELRGKSVTVTGEAMTRHSAMGRYFLKPQNGWDYRVTSGATKRETPNHIRVFKRLKDLGKEIRDGI